MNESAFGTVCLLIVVACGYGYVNYADPESGSLPFLSRESAAKRFPRISVNEIDWSADSRLVLSLSRGEVGPDGPLLLHDRAGSRRAVDIDPEEHLTSVALSRGGRHVLVGTFHGQLLWLDLESGETRILLEMPESLAMKPVTLSPDVRIAAVAAGDGRILVCDVSGETTPRIFRGPPSSVGNLNFSSDGRRLVSAALNGFVSVWDLVAGELEWEIAAHDGPATSAAFLPGGQKVISAGSDDTVRIWNVVDQHEEWTGQFEPGATSTLTLSVDSKMAAWAGRCHKIFVWDLERRRKKFEISTPSFAVFQLKFSPDGKILAAAGFEPMIRLYDTGTGTEMPGIDVGASR